MNNNIKSKILIVKYLRKITNKYYKMPINIKILIFNQIIFKMIIISKKIIIVNIFNLILFKIRMKQKIISRNRNSNQFLQKILNFLKNFLQLKNKAKLLITTQIYKI